MQYLIFAAALAALTGPVSARDPVPQKEGVEVSKPSALRNLVPAEQLERHAAAQYEQMKRTAASQRALGSDEHAQVKRLRAIAARTIPHATRFNPRARFDPRAPASTLARP